MGRAAGHRGGHRRQGTPFQADLGPQPGSVPSKLAGPEVDPEAGATDSHLRTSLLRPVPHRVQAGL